MLDDVCGNVAKEELKSEDKVIRFVQGIEGARTEEVAVSIIQDSLQVK